MQRQDILLISHHSTIQEVQGALQKNPKEIQLAIVYLSQEMMQMILRYLCKHRSTRMRFISNDNLDSTFLNQLNFFKNIFQKNITENVFDNNAFLQDEKTMENLNAFELFIAEYFSSSHLNEDLTDEPPAKYRKMDESCLDAYLVMMMNLLNSDLFDHDLSQRLISLFSDNEKYNFLSFMRLLKERKTVIDTANRVSLESVTPSLSVSSHVSFPDEYSSTTSMDLSVSTNNQIKIYDIPHSDYLMQNNSSANQVPAQAVSDKSSLTKKRRWVAWSNPTEGDKLGKSCRKRKRDIVIPPEMQFSEIHENPYLNQINLLRDEVQIKKSGKGKINVRGQILDVIIGCRIGDDGHTVEFILKENPTVKCFQVNRSLFELWSCNKKSQSILHEPTRSKLLTHIKFCEEITSPEQVWQRLKLLLELGRVYKSKNTIAQEFFSYENIDWKGSEFQDRTAIIKLSKNMNYLPKQINKFLAKRDSAGKISDLIYKHKIDEQVVKIRFKENFSSLEQAFEALGKRIIGAHYKLHDIEAQNSQASTSSDSMSEATTVGHASIDSRSHSTAENHEDVMMDDKDQKTANVFSGAGIISLAPFAFFKNRAGELAKNNQATENHSNTMTIEKPQEEDASKTGIGFKNAIH